MEMQQKYITHLERQVVEKDQYMHSYGQQMLSIIGGSSQPYQQQ